MTAVVVGPAAVGRRIAGWMAPPGPFAEIGLAVGRVMLRLFGPGRGRRGGGTRYAPAPVAWGTGPPAGWFWCQPCYSRACWPHVHDEGSG
jgi:hypothetical protein